MRLLCLAYMDGSLGALDEELELLVDSSTMQPEQNIHMVWSQGHKRDDRRFDDIYASVMGSTAWCVLWLGG